MQMKSRGPIMSPSRWVVTFALAMLLVGSFSYSAEKPKPVTEYEQWYDQLLHLRADETKTATVNNLVLIRDVGKFTLKNGYLSMCAPVNGRVLAALFSGEGNFSMTPPTEIERKQLFRFYGQDSVNMDFKQLFLLFADTTFEELSRKLGLGKGEPFPHASYELDNAMLYLSDDDTRYFDTDFMQTFLHNEQNGLFYAHFSERKPEPFFFEVDPFNEEPISFQQRPDDAHFVHNRECIVQFPSEQQSRERSTEQEHGRYPFRITDYRIDSRIRSNLAFRADAYVTFTSLEDSLRWVHSYLYSKLQVDSAFWRPGAPARFFRGKENPMLWVQMEHRLVKGEVCTVHVYYHGDLLGRDELGWLSIKAPSSWYPRHEFLRRTNFDLTFHVPAKMKFVSVGKKESSAEDDDVSTTRWTTTHPIPLASFNVGYFEEVKLDEDAVTGNESQQKDPLPKITVYKEESGHNQIAQELAPEGIVSSGNMDKDIVADLTNSVSFFQNVFGKCPENELYGTEIPYRHGEAFPGLLHLSWTTYQFSNSKGGNEIFRAHEVAHQWWGIGVGFKTYHDQWLSEGFAEYSGLWYMQTVLKDNKKFFDALDKWKDQIMDNRKYLFGRGQEAGPIWLGYRTQSTKTNGDYDLIIYKKGAWALHMLRNMMIDLQTMKEDRFKDMMRDFYSTYVGKEASTEDFQRIVEKHLDGDMSWFFDQWVRDTRIPEYKFAYRTEKAGDGKFKAQCRVQQENVPAEFRMYVPMLITFADNRFLRLRVYVTGSDSKFDLPLLPLEPKEIIFDDLHSVLCNVENVDWE